MQDTQLPAGEEHPRAAIVGDKVALGPLRRDLLPLYQRWINDVEVNRTLVTSIGVLTLEAEEAWYEGAAKGERETPFTIYERATMRPIGNTSLGQINLVNRTALFGIMIGEKDCWGQGYGTETTRLMLDYGFTMLGLHNVMLTVHSFNERGLRAYRRAGFKEVGRRREAKWLAGRTYDTVYMDCLSSEFESPVLRSLVSPEPGP